MRTGTLDLNVYEPGGGDLRLHLPICVPVVSQAKQF